MEHATLPLFPPLVLDVDTPWCLITLSVLPGRQCTCNRARTLPTLSGRPQVDLLTSLLTLLSTISGSWSEKQRRTDANSGGSRLGRAASKHAWVKKQKTAKVEKLLVTLKKLPVWKVCWALYFMMQMCFYCWAVLIMSGRKAFSTCCTFVPTMGGGVSDRDCWWSRVLCVSLNREKKIRRKLLTKNWMN